MEFDLRPVDFSVLVLIQANPNVNQKRLARALSIDPLCSEAESIRTGASIVVYRH